MSKTNSAPTTTRRAAENAAAKRPARRASATSAPRSTSKKAAPKKKAASKKTPKGPAPTTILLVRHGQTPTTGKVLPGRAKGLHLAELGHEQAEIAAQRIAELDVAAVYSSPLERAKETAAPISKALGLKTKIDRGLFECDFGDWTGESLVTLNKLPEWQTVQRAPSTFRFPGGESFTEMQTRMVSALDRLRLVHPGQTIVCVSHADTIKAAVAHAMGTHLDLFQRIVVSPASVSAITWHAGGPIVLAVNSTGRPLTELRPS
ncbi:MAG: MSMEG_4193 family putative phosphomutase [Ilumatobacter sp.]